MTLAVSIVVPVFNAAPFLEQCVGSLTQQSERSIEIILVDDGSTDGGDVLCDRLATEDDRIRVIHKANGGLSDARNVGLRCASGDYIAFIDADDWAESTMVAELLHGARTRGADVVIAGCIVDRHDACGVVVHSEVHVPPDQEALRGTELHPPQLRNLVNLVGYAWNKLYRRDLLQRGGIVFERGLSLIEDVVFNAQVFHQAGRVALVPRAFVHYVQRPRQTLGATYYPDYLALRERAIGSVGLLLKKWDVEPSARERVLSDMRITAVTSGVRRAVDAPEVGLSAKVDRVRAAATSSVGGALIQQALAGSGLRLRDRIIVVLLTRQRWWVVVVLTELQVKLRKSRAEVRSTCGTIGLRTRKPTAH